MTCKLDLGTLMYLDTLGIQWFKDDALFADLSAVRARQGSNVESIHEYSEFST